MFGVAEKKSSAEDLASLQLPKEIDERFGAWCKRRSKVKRATAARLIERFLALPGPIKSVLLGEEEEGIEVAYAEWLEGMAKELRQRAPQPRFAELVSVRKAPTGQSEPTEAADATPKSRPAKRG